MTFRACVLVKQVPDHEAIVQVESADVLDIENRYVCSFFDEVAVEAALEVSRSVPDCELIALSAGGRRAVDALRRAVALGIDRVEHLGDESLEDGDSLAVAAALAGRLRSLQPDLILCGKQAGHDDQGAVGPMVAELLDIPHVSAITSLEVDAAASSAKITRRLDGDTWTLQAGLPLLVTAEKGLAEPHVPVVTRVMKAMKTQVTNVPLEDLGAEDVLGTKRIRRLRFLPSPSRPAVTLLADVDELVRHLRDRGALPASGGQAR